MDQSRCKLFESRLQSMAVVDAEQSRIEWYKGRSLLRLWREAISNGLAKLVAKTVFWKGSINETAAFSYYLRLAYMRTRSMTGASTGLSVFGAGMEMKMTTEGENTISKDVTDKTRGAAASRRSSYCRCAEPSAISSIPFDVDARSMRWLPAT